MPCGYRPLSASKGDDSEGSCGAECDEAATPSSGHPRKNDGEDDPDDEEREREDERDGSLSVGSRAPATQEE